MKQLCMTLTALMMSSLLWATPTKVSVNFGGFSLDNKATIRLRDTSIRYTQPIDENRTAHFDIDVDEPTYCSLSIGSSRNQIYIVPGKDMLIKLVNDPEDKVHKSYNLVKLNLEFEGGDVKMNKYLQDFTYTTIADSCFLLPEKEYIDLVEKTIALDAKAIKKFKLSKEQETLEMARDKYHLYEIMARYPVQHFWKGGNYVNIIYKHDDPLPIVKEYIAKQYVDDAELWKNTKYQRFVKSAIGVLSDENFVSDWNVIMQLRIDYMLRYFKTPIILEDLMHQFALSYTEAKQAGTLGKFEAVYDHYVKSEAHHEELKKAQAMWLSYMKGQAVLSADAPYQTVDGKTVSLKDLKGKYLFIDVWATWCGPCRQEIPSLQKLEQKYKGRNIEFVSISIDNTVAPWIKMVKNDNMTGLQLWGGPNAPICKDYGITEIPRFILIDPEGNMVDSNMSRPSAPETDAFIAGLKGL